jgi:hypothetical protein
LRLYALGVLEQLTALVRKNLSRPELHRLILDLVGTKSCLEDIVGSNKINLRNAAFAVAIILLPARTVFASTLDLSFTGQGSGTVTVGSTTTTFTDQDFSVTFVEDTTTVSQAGGYDYDNPAGDGTFTEGAYTATINNANVAVNGNGNTGFGSYYTVFLFNSDFGSSIGISEDSVLSGYGLKTAITTGSIPSSSTYPSPNIAAYQDTLGFTTSGGATVEFTSLDSLDFTASVPTTSPVPEPSMLFFTLSVLAGFVVVRRFAQPVRQLGFFGDCQEVARLSATA